MTKYYKLEKLLEWLSVCILAIVVLCTMNLYMSYTGGNFKSNTNKDIVRITNDYYETERFEKLIFEEINGLIEDKDKGNVLLNKSHINYFIEDISNEKYYTNTSHTNYNDFKEDDEIYCKIEILNQGKLYIKEIDEDKQQIYNQEGYLNIKDENLNISMSFKKDIEVDSILYGDYYEFTTSVKIQKVSLVVLIIGMLSLIIILISHRKISSNNKDKVYKYRPIKQIILVLLVEVILVYISIFKLQILSTTSNNLIRFIILVLIIKILKWLIFNIRYKYINRQSTVNIITTTSKNLKSFVRKQFREVSFLKEVFIVGNIIIIVNCVVIFLFNKSAIKYVEIIALVISFEIFIVYIMKNTAYINYIIRGTKRIKEEDKEYKLLVKGEDNFSELANNINLIKEEGNRQLEELLSNEKDKIILVNKYVNNIIDSLGNEEIKVDIKHDISVIKNLTVEQKEIEYVDVNNIMDSIIENKSEEISSRELEIIKINEQVLIKSNEYIIKSVLSDLIEKIITTSLEKTRIHLEVNNSEKEIRLIIKSITIEESNGINEFIQEVYTLLKSQGVNIEATMDGDLSKVIMTIIKPPTENNV